MCPSMSGEELWCRCRARGGAALASPGALERDEWAAGPGPGPMEQGMPMNGGRFDFDDGGTYCGGWEDGKAHGHGVCTGPKGQGEYSGAWHYGFEVSGIYTWPSGNTYEGQWQNGKRHGLGVEKRGRWLYRGEWSQGYKGRYGMRQSTNSQAKYEGTWSSGLQDGYGTETYADGGTYEGQWLRGMRHGYGIRKSAPYGVAAKYRSRSHAHASLTSLRSEMGDQDTAGAPPPAPSSKRHVADESRGGFVLRAHSEPPVRRRSLSERSIAVKRTILQGLRITKQRSTGDIHARVSSGTGSIRSSGSTASCTSDESGFGGAADDAGGHHSLAQEEFLDPATTETYMGEWKNDKRSGFGISERSDGLKYEGEWFSNKKFGYGATTLKDGTREEGKYKNNILVTSQRKKHLLFVRSSKLRERIDAATKGANRAAQIALQKADIAISRTSTAKDRAEQADYAALQSKEDSDVARLHANEFDPAFRQPFAQGLPQEDFADLQPTPPNHYPSTSALHHPPHTALPPDQLSPGEPDSATLSPDLSPPMLTPPSEMPPPFQPSPTQPAAAPPEEQPSTSGAGPSGSQAPLQPQLSEERAIVHAPPEAAQPPAQPVAPPPAPVQQTPPATRNRPGPPIKQTSFGSQGGGREERRPESAAPSAVAASAESPYHHNLPGSPHGRLPRLPAAVDFKDSGGGGEEGVRRRRGERSHERPTTTGRPVRSQSHDQRQAQPRSAASLTQILTDDHFDQYALAANPYAAKIAKLSSSSRQNTPRQRTEEEAEEEVGQEEAADAVPDLSPGGSNIRPAASALPLGQMTIIRRSTLATAQDWKGLAEAEGAPTPAAAQVKSSLERGSLPNLEVLDEAPVQMTREVASRLGSQRRQELQRMAEEDELRVHNPLRYLFHPSLLELFHRWKFFLLVLFVNACLSILFYNLLFFFATDDPDAS